MSEFKEKLIRAGMSESLATLLDEKLAGHPSCCSDADSVSARCDSLKRWCTGKRRLPVLSLLAALAVITLAALKYLLLHW